MSDKKITFLINSLGGGGAENVCAILANGLAKSGWKITLIVLHLEHSIHHKQLDNTIDIVVLEKQHSRTALISLIKHILKSRPNKFLVFNHQLAICLVLARILLREDFAIISRNISTLSEARKIQGSFWHKHAVDYILKLFYSKVNRIIAQSHDMRKDLTDYYSINPSKIVVIPNPINPGIDEHRMKNINDVDNKRDYLLCVGRLEPAKAFDYAIRAFSIIKNDFPHLRLKFVGSGSSEDLLRANARALKVEHLVDFEGFQLNTSPYYANAKATILTSLYEGFPNVLIESIAHGTPVIAFDCKSGPNEIIEENVNGHLVRYQDEPHLAKAMRQAAGRDWDASTVCATAARYSPEPILSRYAEEISNLTA
ncbi:glycosyltransferase [Pelagicoccus sp. SDUM812002]|uniref:glycosyltransferase n=1 Tax=Pelagicoccus sp. SDUM812002 TaxID=3041266 RepID=UPI00280F0178|nr:glycosyltransferase [Pelagicoccus sp. SDUM812002]MDQ8186293.1 glycosyltransferase [Pelagicoccus sp. SDUM812002]